MRLARFAPLLVVPILFASPTPADDATAPAVASFAMKELDRSLSVGYAVLLVDVNGDGKPDIVTGAGPGGGPHVRVYDGSTGAVMQNFYAFAPTYAGGVYVTAGDIVGDGKAEVAVGSGTGLEQVKVYDHSGNALRTYTINDPSAIFGVHVGMADVDGDGKQDLLLSVGTSVQARNALTNATKVTFTPFDPTVAGGVFVG
jgi:hypothetical protein